MSISDIFMSAKKQTNKQIDILKQCGSSNVFVFVGLYSEKCQSNFFNFNSNDMQCVYCCVINYSNYECQVN